jgi:hypothetical protein
MSNEVVKKEGAAVAVQAQENAQPMSIDQLKNRVVLIQGAMKSVMKDGEDYGTVLVAAINQLSWSLARKANVPLPPFASLRARDEGASKRASRIQHQMQPLCV